MTAKNKKILKIAHLINFIALLFVNTIYIQDIILERSDPLLSLIVILLANVLFIFITCSYIKNIRPNKVPVKIILNQPYLINYMLVSTKRNVQTIYVSTCELFSELTLEVISNCDSKLVKLSPNFYLIILKLNDGICENIDLANYSYFDLESIIEEKKISKEISTIKIYFYYIIINIVVAIVLNGVRRLFF